MSNRMCNCIACGGYPEPTDAELDEYCWNVECVIMHERNQAIIDQGISGGWFDPICPWFDVRLENEWSVPICFNKNNPFHDEGASCYPSGCPTGWLG